MKNFVKIKALLKLIKIININLYVCALELLNNYKYHLLSTCK
jgi:hypothetical protein